MKLKHWYRAWVWICVLAALALCFLFDNAANAASKKFKPRSHHAHLVKHAVTLPYKVIIPKSALQKRKVRAQSRSKAHRRVPQH